MFRLGIKKNVLQNGGCFRFLSTVAKETFQEDPRFGDVLKKVLTQQLAEIQEAGLYKNERIITSPQSPIVDVAGIDKPLINLCANNYLGLSNHPALVNAARSALDTHGYGLSSVRFICGTQDLHKQLEEKISKFHGTEDTILYPSCFDANAGFFEALLTSDDAIISDALNHASIIDGVRLCKARRLRYAHADMEALETQLRDAQDSRIKVIVTDGVFSMDGEIAPLKDICALAKRYNAAVLVDDCHATGFLGKSGRGTDEHCEVQGQVDVINSTLGKALGGATGGYTTGRKEIIDMLRQKSRPYLFSNTLAPTVVGASVAAFDLLESSTELRDRLEKNTEQFRKGMKNAGFKIKGESHPIVPVMFGDAKIASQVSERLLEQGIYVVAFSYPVVPKDTARIRVQVSAAHTDEQIDKAIHAFTKVGKMLGLID